MKVDLLDDFGAIDARAWDALAADSPTNTLCQAWAWQGSWWRAHGRAGRQLRLFALYDGDRLRAVMPLFLENGVLKFVGDGSADRLDLIYDARCPGDLAAFFVPLKECDDWQEIELNAIPDVSPTGPYLKAAAEEVDLFSFSAGKYPLWGIQFQGQEAHVTRSLHAGALAKHAGIFASKGTVRTVHIDGVAAQELPWKEFFIQHIHRWMLRVAPSRFVARQERDFLRYVCAQPLLRSGLVFTTLYLNDHAAGYHVGFLRDAVFYSCVFSFDVALKRFSPDDVLWREVVAYALKHGCRRIVFVDPDEPVIRRHAVHVGSVRSIRVCRSRREKWLKKARLWANRVPFARDSRVFMAALWETLAVFFWRRKMVQEAKACFPTIVSFDDVHVRRVSACSDRLLLARPEVELLRRLRPELDGVRMLDMGVGCGRTGVYFAPAVKSYTAFDRVEPEVAGARVCLDDQVAARDIFVADASQMSFAVDGAYDLILFGGEGIDEIPEDARRRIFEEVRRVGKEGAWFCFSSRNLQSLAPGKGFGAVDFLRRLRRRMLLSVANQGLARLRRQPMAMLVDESSGYRLSTYYGTPKEQVRVLKELGFHDIRVFSTRTGLEVRDWRRWDKLIDDSVYYLCRV